MRNATLSSIVAMTLIPFVTGPGCPTALPVGYDFYDDVDNYYEDFYQDVAYEEPYTDFCEVNGWYGDGVCDDCPYEDPDCVGDICEANGWYNDAICDSDCALPDPDCDDFCIVNDWYSDGVCDPDCPLPDPDCSDPCALDGWYGDGICDAGCPMPDPDC